MLVWRTYFFAVGKAANSCWGCGFTGHCCIVCAKALQWGQCRWLEKATLFGCHWLSSIVSPLVAPIVPSEIWIVASRILLVYAVFRDSIDAGSIGTRDREASWFDIFCIVVAQLIEFCSCCWLQWSWNRAMRTTFNWTQYQDHLLVSICRAQYISILFQKALLPACYRSMLVSVGQLVGQNPLTKASLRRHIRSLVLYSAAIAFRLPCAAAAATLWKISFVCLWSSMLRSWRVSSSGLNLQKCNTFLLSSCLCGLTYRCRRDSIAGSKCPLMAAGS